MSAIRRQLHALRLRAALALSVMGPGIITASADNDAAGIATYSVAGSTFGYAFLWVLVWVTVGEVVVQEMAARMGAVTGKGLADLVRERFGARAAVLLVSGLALANLGTTTAQFAGIAASAELLGVTRYVVVPLAGIAVWSLVLRESYTRVERAMLALSLFALAYVASALLVSPDWGEVLQNAARPTVRMETGFLLALLATVGTTITPWGCAYLQASIADKGIAMTEYGYTRLDVMFGAALGNVVSAFIVICTAASLFAHGISVTTAEQAALALVPLAGSWAKPLFAFGLLGASLLGASVLPLATTYGVCEALGWERGVDRSTEEAPAFYGLYSLLILLGCGIVLLPGIALFPLMWLSQVLNSALLPAVLMLMLLLANDSRTMKEWRNGRASNWLTLALGILVSMAGMVLVFGAR